MKHKSLDTAKAVEGLPGVIRRTLAYNDEAMLCYFTIRKGASIPLHNHRPTQIGFLVSGHARFFGATDADAFEVKPGDGYVINPNAQHGLEALEDSVYIEVFCPSRDDYRDF